VKREGSSVTERRLGKVERKSLSRRDFLRLAAGAASGAVLAGCAPPTPATPEVIKETVEVPVKVTVEVPIEPTGVKNAFGYVEWHPDEPVEVAHWGRDINTPEGPGAVERRTLEGFHTMYPNIRVKVDPATWFGAVTPYEKYATAFAAGVGTPATLCMHVGSDICVFSEWTKPITEEHMPVEDRERFGYFQMRLLETRGQPDVVTELGSVMWAPLLYYRPDLLEEAGLTADDLGEYWEDAIPAMQEITKVAADGTILQAAFSHWRYVWPNFVAQAGSPYFNKETQRFEWSTDEAFIYACQFFRDMHQKYKIISPETPEPSVAMPDGFAATGLCDGWLERYFRNQRPDCDYRARPILKLKNQVGTKQLKGRLSQMYAFGTGVCTGIEDPIVERAALEWWKYCYYNAAVQFDLGRENGSFCTLANPPDYDQMVANSIEGGVLPKSGSIPKSARIAETLWTSYTEEKDRTEWDDHGRLRQQHPIYTPLTQEVAGTDRPIVEILEEYQALIQADWEQNLWNIPGVVYKKA